MCVRVCLQNEAKPPTEECRFIPVTVIQLAGRMECVCWGGGGGGGGRHVMSSDTGFRGEGSVNAAFVIKINQKKKEE